MKRQARPNQGASGFRVVLVGCSAPSADASSHCPHIPIAALYTRNLSQPEPHRAATGARLACWCARPASGPLAALWRLSCLLLLPCRGVALCASVVGPLPPMGPTVPALRGHRASQARSCAIGIRCGRRLPYARPPWTTRARLRSAGVAPRSTCCRWPGWPP